MGVAAHLAIDLAEYDARIRTFIPDYEEMLDVAAAAVPAAARRIVDFGTGTGALASRCARRAPRARIVGIDSDRDVLAVAARRLGARASFVRGSFLRVEIPDCDVAVASIALHHIRTRAARRRFYRRLRRSIRPRGRLIVVDCYPSAIAAVARGQHVAWDRHLRRRYSRREARRLFTSWSAEDVYVPLEAELTLLAAAGFKAHVVWRKGAFAVLVATRSG